jgi:hypothetical protein
MLHETLMIWRTVYVNVTWDYDDLKNCLCKCYMRLWWFEELCKCYMTLYDDLNNCLCKCYMKLWWFEELFR